LDRRVTITALRIRIANVRSLRSNGDRVLLKLAVDLLSKDEEASLLASLGEDDIMGIWIELATGLLLSWMQKGIDGFDALGKLRDNRHVR
jgi:hypothetical protein